jgi:hypothetical protein
MDGTSVGCPRDQLCCVRFTQAQPGAGEARASAQAIRPAIGLTELKHRRLCFSPSARS